MNPFHILVQCGNQAFGLKHCLDAFGEFRIGCDLEILILLDNCGEPVVR